MTQLQLAWLFAVTTKYSTDPGGSAVWGVGLRPPACWDCAFEFPPPSPPPSGHGRLSLMSVVLSGRNLWDELIAECGVSEGDREASIMNRSWASTARCAMEKVKR
jgi:hypothetical protein